jgi:predicted dehydrogenase
MRLAIIGCGYIAASYAEALDHHPELSLVGAWDRSSDNLAAFASRWPCRNYTSREELLADETVALVLNLTNPRSHAEVSRAALEAGKHVYSEKPLAMTGPEALDLVQLARRRGLMLASAPCSVLSETAETAWHALRSGVIGRVRLVYANFDDGMIAPHMAPWQWSNAAGVKWPAKDEFEVGCTHEHAGYLLSWLCAFFGPVRRVTSFASCQIPDKGVAVNKMAPDFTVGCLEYDEGIVARLTCSLVAPLDKSLIIFGDRGVLKVDNVRHERCPVRYRLYKQGRLATGIERRINGVRLALGMTEMEPGRMGWRRHSYVAKPPAWLAGRKPVDFMRGPAEMAAALKMGRACQLPAELGWHIADLVDALQYPDAGGGRRVISSTFPRLAPMFHGAEESDFQDTTVQPPKRHDVGLAARDSI